MFFGGRNVNRSQTPGAAVTFIIGNINHFPLPGKQSRPIHPLGLMGGWVEVGGWGVWVVGGRLLFVLHSFFFCGKRAAR